MPEDEFDIYGDDLDDIQPIEELVRAGSVVRHWVC